MYKRQALNHVLLENKEINKTHKINEIKRPNDKVNSVCQSKCLVNPCPLDVYKRQQYLLILIGISGILSMCLPGIVTLLLQTAAVLICMK